MVQYGVATLAMVLLAGCFGPGEMRTIPIEMPDGSKATILDHNQMVPDWMLSSDKLALNVLVPGEVTSSQSRAIDEAEKKCRIHAQTVRPSKWVSVGASTVLYGIPEAAGAAAGVQAFSGAIDTAAYVSYVGGVAGGGGFANGVFTLGGQTYTFEDCGRELFDLFKQFNIRVLIKSPY